MAMRAGETPASGSSASLLSTEIETFGKEIRALEDEYQQVQVAIRNASPAYAALTQPQPLGLKEIQQLLEREPRRGEGDEPHGRCWCGGTDPLPHRELRCSCRRW